jgi:hypothetical protein
MHRDAGDGALRRKRAPVFALTVEGDSRARVAVQHRQCFAPRQAKTMSKKPQFDSPGSPQGKPVVFDSLRLGRTRPKT